MRKIAMMAAALLVAAPAWAADPIEGVWKTQPDEGSYAHVTMKPCGNAYCGTITRTFNGSGEYKSPNLGKRLVIDMVPQGGGNYKGNVWRPSNNKVYIGKIALSGKSMKLSGCVAGGLLCSKQTWAKIK